MTDDDLKRVIKESIGEAFTLYGFDISNPTQLQQDMTYMRKMRLGCEATKRNIFKAVITVTIPAALYIIWESLRRGFLGE